MENPEQLVLFDLEPYTVKQCTATDCEEYQVKEIQSQNQSQVEYVQLELDLFPRSSYPIPLDLPQMAA